MFLLVTKPLIYFRHNSGSDRHLYLIPTKKLECFKLLKVCKIIFHIAFLYCIYLFGNWIQTSLGLVVPGSVIGMIILFILLTTNVIKVSWIEDGARFIVDNLALFFVPATVGIMNYFELFAGKGILLVMIVLFSTFLVMATSGITSQQIMYRKERKEKERG